MDKTLLSFGQDSSWQSDAKPKNETISCTCSVPCKHAISKSSLPGLEYTFNPYVGCSHGCVYCYVPDVLRYTSQSQEWGKQVSVKAGILERLKEDLRRSKPGVIGVSTATDPYQPIERCLEVTRGALQILKASGFSASIQTKSSLVRRDLEIIKGGKFELGLTINSLDDGFRRLFEPGASPPEERVAALNDASSLGIATWIFYGPIVPGYNDSPENVSAVVAIARKTHSRLLYDRLNLKPLLLNRIKRNVSEKVIVSAKNYNFSEVYQKIEKECAEQGVRCNPAF